MSAALWFYALATCVKLLLIPSYRSTDFEVHRHWLALTHSLPLSRWYTDETSPWTLDYPPFFAYFELALSYFAHLIDPQITHLHLGLNYKAKSVIYFQRVSVIVADMVLAYAVHRLTRNLENSLKKSMLCALIIWAPGLMIVDHVHFQYNGFLLGLLMLSISYLQEGRDLIGGFCFAVLICFKHLFAIAAPLFFVYLLRRYCWKHMMTRLPTLGAIVIAVFCAAYGPFFYHMQMQWVLRRLFPFGRGLCHAYWAPNFWVFYIMSDKAMAFGLKKLGFSIETASSSFTGGLVGDSSPFAVLPQVTPLISLTAVLVALSPCLVKAWKNPRPHLMVRWISYAYTCGFLFGFHVHEKASLHFVIPLSIVAVQSLEDARHYFVLSIASCYSLFPLLHEPQEHPIKIILLLLHCVLMLQGFTKLFWNQSSKFSNKRHYGNVGKLYVLGFVAVELWAQFLQTHSLGDRYPFLHLMVTSSYCAFGIMYSWFFQFKSLSAYT